MTEEGCDAPHADEMVVLLVELQPELDLVARIDAFLHMGRRSFRSCKVLPENMASLGSAPPHGPSEWRAAIVIGDGGRLDHTVRCLRAHGPDAPVLWIAPPTEPHAIADRLELGIDDFLTPPFDASDVLPRLWRLLGRGQDTPPRPQLRERLALRQLVGVSAAFTAVLAKIPVFARSDATVLITGETGTGKDVCARAIHYLSSRSDRPFVPVNCGAIPLELVENELFGHEKAAYTGATASFPGLVHQAEGGTLFLDEIDALPQQAQVKLLRLLQDREYRPLGAAQFRSANIRVVTATNSDVDEAVRCGQMRKDLYYRLNVLSLNLPPLRERVGDIPILARHFVAKFGRRSDGRTAVLSCGALDALTEPHDWPGNVRELEHVIERALVLAADHVLIRRADVKPESPVVLRRSFKDAKAEAVARFERTYVESLLQVHVGNVTHAAEAARKNRRAFWELMRKHRIDPRRFRASGT
jgi:two-component system, NtrC family, response regulator GlrR